MSGGWQDAPTGQIPIWKFTEETIHEGQYLGVRQLDPQYKPLYIVGDKLVPAKSQIDKAFANIPIGSQVRLEFLGKESIKGGKTVNNFKVQYKAAAQAAAQPDEADDDEEPF